MGEKFVAGINMRHDLSRDLRIYPGEMMISSRRNLQSHEIQIGVDLPGNVGVD